MHLQLIVFVVCSLLVLASAAAAEPPKDLIVSPEISPDRHVTFRIEAPNASKVLVEGQFRTTDLTKDAKGVWSATVGPLDPGIYFYYFSVDGVQTVDPRNPNTKRYVPTTSLFEVHGDKPQIWEPQTAKHGTVRVEWYTSKVLGEERRLHVYTPPGYSDKHGSYPTLYLLHGWGDDDSSWIDCGRANFILDNLIAQAKARPMVVVMPYGHTFDPVTPTEDSDWEHFGEKIEKHLVQEVVPLIESKYRVSKDASSRALAGLSMGGGQSLQIGLDSTSKFAWIGGFSSGLITPEAFEKLLPADAKQANERIKLLWIGCGKKDFLYKGNVAMVDAAKAKGLNVTWVSTEGGHSWGLWRDYLADFASRLFR